MGKLTVHKLPVDHWTCEVCCGILKEFGDQDSEHGGIGIDIPCPVAMNAMDTYGIAKECTYAEEQKQTDQSKEEV
jgi:hypothetical protein